MQASARNIIDTVPHPLLVLDANLRLILANPAYCLTFGCTSPAVEGYSLFEIDGGRWNRPSLRTLLGDVINRNSFFIDYELECDCPRVGRREFVLKAHRVFRDEGGRHMVLLAIEDDTELHRIKDELRQSKIELEDQGKAMDRQLRDLARSVESTRHQTLLQSELKIAALEQKARDLANFVEGLRNQTRLQADAKIALLMQKAQDLAVSVEALREITLQHSDSQIAALDQSEKVTSRLNEELERSALERNRQLEAANRELEAFCYSVSHDLRTPLRALDGFSRELIESHSDRLDEQGLHYLRRIRAGTQRMGRLIDDLLKLSRVTRVEMTRERVDLSALAETVFAELQELEPGRVVSFTVGPGLFAECDFALMRVVFENLLGNAWKFTSKNPTAAITFDQTEVEGQRAFVIRDDGAGFDSAYMGKLFGAFQRLHSDRDFPGTGIGLATVQRVVHRHGGRVWAEGAVGRGAALYFTMPGSEYRI
ncbi:PAS domain-containing protein [Telmatocola sphagniphila]|uniref:histidine kinase n=1 Tax=Telmatocola sphagniphila TaxID=1123043 RepID=A0A8E6BB11_9BACT|nr:ATP-binding protein [Telmatocola sphagniphila]QVL33858.1 PAS domain-containing protein [Telmatocola sphagniphila]